MELREIMLVAVPIIGGIIWAIRLEGRQTAHERECAERQKRMDERHDVSVERLANIDKKLDRLLDHSNAGRGPARGEHAAS